MVQKKTSLQFSGFILTNPLWRANTPFGLKQFEFPVLKDKIAIDPLKDCPTLHTNFVLGKRAETFFQLAIQSSPQYEVLASNIQISREKITLGEIDFLLKDSLSEKICHVELVYKFYIYDPSFPEELQRWIGPNRKDSLLRKISRLQKHQLPLLKREETRQIMESLKIDTGNIEQEVCFLANLFVPKNLIIRKFPFINNNCISGYWIHQDNFSKKTYGSYYFFTPKKPDWPILPKKNTEWYSYSEIRLIVEDLIDKKKSPLIWMKSAAGEYERFFIVWW